MNNQEIAIKILAHTVYLNDCITSLNIFESDDHADNYETLATIEKTRNEIERLEITLAVREDFSKIIRINS